MADFNDVVVGGTEMATPVAGSGSGARPARDATHRPGESRRPGGSRAAGAKRPIVSSADEFQEQPVSWQWKGRVPLGAVTSLEGPPGVGKSMLTVEIAARLSRGEAMPFDDTAPWPPAGSLFMCAEDSYSATIKPRLWAAGADLSRVHFYEGTDDGSGQTPPALPDDLDQIESVILGHGIRFLVIDPISSFLGAGYNIANERPMRKLLTLLTRLAARTGSAVMPIRHFHKGGGASIHRGVGSNAFSAVVRSILAVDRDPRDQDARILKSVKSNLGATPPSVSFKLEPAGDVARIAWQGEIEPGADDPAAGAKSRTADGGPEVERAMEFLTDILGTGPLEFNVIETMRVAEHISETTIRRAKGALGVKSVRTGFRPEDIRAYWVLPGVEYCVPPRPLALPAGSAAAAGPQP